MIIHNKTSNRLENVSIETNVQYNSSDAEKWIYFCQSFILKNNIKTYNSNDDSNAISPLMKLSTYRKNSKYFSRIEIKIRRDLFHPDANFNQLDFKIKIKNTNSFLRAKNIKIFYDIDNSEKMKYLLFNSIFFSSFLGIKKSNYLFISFNELTKNKTITYSFEDKSTYLQENYLKEKINSYPELASDNEFDFPKLFEHLEYKLIDRFTDNINNNRTEIGIKFNLNYYMKNFTIKFRSMLNSLSNKNIISYLENGFSWDPEVEILLDNLFDYEVEKKLNSKSVDGIIEMIFNYHGRLILTNTLGNNKNKKSNIDSDNTNLLLDSTKRFEHFLTNFSVTIPINQLNSVKFFIFEIKDINNITVFSDFQINYFNDFPYKKIETPNPDIEKVTQNIIIDQNQFFYFNFMFNSKTIVNCFWLNIRNYYLNYMKEIYNFKIGFDVYFGNSSINYLKASISSNFFLYKKTIEKFKHSFYNHVDKKETSWYFNNKFIPSSDQAFDYKTKLIDKEWNYFCSFTNINNNIESAVFINDIQLFTIQEKFSTNQFLSGFLKFNVTSTDVLFGDFKLNMIDMQDPINFPNLYFAYKYNGMYNYYQNLFFYNLTSRLQNHMDTLKLDCIKSVKSNYNIFISRYIIFDSLEPEISQIFTEGFPKIEKYDDKFLQFKIRFNPDFVFKLFFKRNQTPEFMFAFLDKFKLLKENDDNKYLNNRILLIDSLKEDSSFVLNEYALTVKLNNRIILLSKKNYLNELAFIIDNLGSFMTKNPQIAKSKIL